MFFKNVHCRYIYCLYQCSVYRRRRKKKSALEKRLDKSTFLNVSHWVKQIATNSITKKSSTRKGRGEKKYIGKRKNFSRILSPNVYKSDLESNLLIYSYIPVSLFQHRPEIEAGGKRENMEERQGKRNKTKKRNNIKRERFKLL